jgi:hypothetical protein
LGFENLEVIDRTPSHSSGPRGEEIQAWIVKAIQDGKQIDNYVILDDDSDMLPQQKAEHFVHISNLNGMLLEHYRKALKILNPTHLSLKHFPEGKYCADGFDELEYEHDIS